MSYLENQKNKNTPFAKKQKAQETKPVKIRADLHYKLNLYKAKHGGNITLTDLINQSVTEFFENHDEVNVMIEDEMKR